MYKSYEDYRYELVNENKHSNTINKLRVNGIDYDIGPAASMKPYNIETFNVDEGDVILLHLSKNCDIDDINAISQEIKKIFPNNTILAANELILEGISIIKKPPTGKIAVTENLDIRSEYPELFDWGISL